MQDDSLDPLREILHAARARYLTVRPEGLLLDESGPPLARVTAKIFGHGGARTLYRGRQPHCRSLDGVRALDDPAKSCRTCYLRKHCTPQVRVDLEIAGRPYKLLLAYTSARSFLAYVEAMTKAGRDPIETATMITVVSRGSWGELRFEPLDLRRRI